MDREEYISQPANLELAIYGLKDNPPEIEYSQCGQKPLLWENIANGYATSLYLPYDMAKSLVNLLSTLYPENEILYRLSWCREKVIFVKNQGYDGIAFTNDKIGNFFRDRYLWQTWDFVVYESTQEKCLAEMNVCIDALNNYYRAEHEHEVENIDDEMEEHFTMESTENLLRTPVLIVDSIDELDYILSSDQNDIQYFAYSGKTIAEAISKADFPTNIERMLIILCPGKGCQPSTDELQPLRRKLSEYSNHSIDVDFKLCPYTTESDTTEIRIITKA